jgi:hypothetical protein
MNAKINPTTNMGGISRLLTVITASLTFRVRLLRKAVTIWGMAVKAVKTPTTEPIMMVGAPSSLRKRGTTA